VFKKSKHDGTYTVQWHSDNTFTINVIVAPTTDIKLYASSYHLTNPAYAGGCFQYNSATSPQTYDGNTQVVILPAGQTGTRTVTVQLPSTCYNEQVDLYYGDAEGNPLNGEVGGRGHDAYGYVSGSIMLTALNPACQGGKGGGSTTPTTPTAHAAVAPAATLVDTGANTGVTSILAGALIAAALFVATRRTAISK
jgi:hypothetical protein